MHPDLADELERRFTYHAPRTPERAAEHDAVRQSHLALAKQMAALLPEGREKALVVKSLEESMFWANAAVARQPDEAPVA
jgi:hypothetical protein